MDEPRVDEIVRHLVGDPFRRGRQSPNGLQVALPELVQLIARSDRNRLRERNILRTTQALRQLSEVEELARAEDPGVARQDLLDQGGAGTWHTDDEDRDLGGLPD